MTNTRGRDERDGAALGIGARAIPPSERPSDQGASPPKRLANGRTRDLYVQPPPLPPSDVPADLLTRLRESPQVPHSGDPYALPESLKSVDLH